jgi:hypothetical protein
MNMMGIKDEKRTQRRVPKATEPDHPIAEIGLFAFFQRFTHADSDKRGGAVEWRARERAEGEHKRAGEKNKREQAGGTKQENAQENKQENKQGRANESGRQQRSDSNRHTGQNNPHAASG